MIEWVPGFTLETVEQLVIEQAFKFYRNNKTQTAQSLGIAIRTLDSKLEIYEQRRTESTAQFERIKREREIELARHRSFQSQPKSISSSHEGIRVEPAYEIASQSSMSVLERTQVQEVLPRQVAKSRHARER